MLFTNIAPAALAALTVLVPSTLAAPAPEAVGVEVPVAEVAARAPEDIVAREIDELPTRDVEEVEARQANTVTLQLFGTNTCNSGSGGPHRTYNRNQCVTLAAHTRGINLIRGPCFIYTYEDGTCGKNPRTFKGGFCLNTQTQPRWSFKVVC
ncbi:hypothetical protein N0V92_013440 [Colletotrichum tropicale]|nr:hypothetical protein N0V92_013440 [Colletotrichum tropicale]